MTTQTQIDVTPTDVQNAAVLSMLATHCAVCRKSLRDPASVELGIGPECRKRHSFDLSMTTREGYVEAKALILRIALEVSADKLDPHRVLVTSDRLQELGFMALAQILIKRNAKVSVIDYGNGRLLVKTPLRALCLSGILPPRWRPS